MGTTAKRSFTTTAELAQAADQEARRNYGGNFSRLVSEALARHLRGAALREYLATTENELGGIDPEVRRDVAKRWPA